MAAGSPALTGEAPNGLAFFCRWLLPNSSNNLRKSVYVFAPENFSDFLPSVPESQSHKATVLYNSAAWSVSLPPLPPTRMHAGRTSSLPIWRALPRNC
jgi:hypothetical protein